MHNTNPMKKSILIKSALWLSGILVVLSGVLFFHIYQITHKPKSHNDQIQLSRIDFQQKIDSSEAGRIRAYVQSLDGVENTYFNVKNSILVYTYEVGKQNSASVFKQVVDHGNYKAKRYMVSAEEATKGCPAFARQGTFRTKLVTLISGL